MGKDTTSLPCNAYNHIDDNFFSFSIDRLEALRQKLSSNGISDVLFLGVNSKRWHAQVMAAKLRQVVNFPIHQATHTNDIFKLLGGRKDDVFVYDRCVVWTNPLSCTWQKTTRGCWVRGMGIFAGRLERRPQQSEEH